MAASDLFVAFVGDPLDLDLFPPHGSAAAVGGAKGGAWSRPKVISGGCCPSLKCLRDCRAGRQAPSHTMDGGGGEGGGGGEEEQGFLRSWSCGRGPGQSFTSAQQPLETQPGDARLRPLTHKRLAGVRVCVCVRGACVDGGCAVIASLEASSPHR